MEADGLPAPTFSELTDGVGVTFAFRESLGESTVSTESAVSLSNRKIEMLHLLHSPLSATELQEKLTDSPSLRTVQADLLELHNQGCVSKTGKGKSTLWKAS